MDTEQQVGLNFLDEVDDYVDQLETVTLSLANDFSPTAIDQAMRATHSVKGKAAMMGFSHLSQIAHRLEDFFKILQLRGAEMGLTVEVESLLLLGVNALRLASRCGRQGMVMDDEVMATKIQPIFDSLYWFLGDLRPEEADRLLAQGENVPVTTVDYFRQWS